METVCNSNVLDSKLDLEFQLASEKSVLDCRVTSFQSKGIVAFIIMK